MTNRNRYTLIEMLVVIAIIAVLAGLLFPAINIARERAKENQALAGVNVLTMALQQYKSVYYRFPSSIPTGTLIGGTTSNTSAYVRISYQVRSRRLVSNISNFLKAYFNSLATSPLLTPIISGLALMTIRNPFFNASL